MAAENNPHFYHFGGARSVTGFDLDCTEQRSAIDAAAAARASLIHSLISCIYSSQINENIHSCSALFGYSGIGLPAAAAGEREREAGGLRFAKSARPQISHFRK